VRRLENLRQCCPQVVDSLDRIDHPVRGALDLATELESMGAATDLTELENSFVEVAKAYGDRKGISYASWREVGVTAAVLKRADIGRGA